MIRVSALHNTSEGVQVILEGLPVGKEAGECLLPASVERRIASMTGVEPQGPHAYHKVDDGALVQIRTALYWADKDRKYKATNPEIRQKRYVCPRDGKELIPTAYKRESGKSVKLLGCKKCLFLIRAPDIIGHHNAVPETRKEL